MARKKKTEPVEPEPQVTKCPYCGADVLPGHYCRCPEGRKAFAAKLYNKHYAGKTRPYEE